MSLVGSAIRAGGALGVTLAAPLVAAVGLTAAFWAAGLALAALGLWGAGARKGGQQADASACAEPATRIKEQA
ncbi:MAG: hypothetical protein ACK4N5_14660 [Myxococcales bacterium]